MSTSRLCRCDCTEDLKMERLFWLLQGAQCNLKSSYKWEREKQRSCQMHMRKTHWPWRWLEPGARTWDSFQKLRMARKQVSPRASGGDTDPPTPWIAHPDPCATFNPQNWKRTNVFQVTPFGLGALGRSHKNVIQPHSRGSLVWWNQGPGQGCLDFILWKTEGGKPTKDL